MQKQQSLIVLDSTNLKKVNVKSGAIIDESKAKNKIGCCYLSKNSRLLIIAYNDKPLISIFDSKNIKNSLRNFILPDIITCLCLSTNDKFLAGVFKGRYIFIWNLKSGECVGMLDMKPEFVGSITQMRFVEDSNILIVIMFNTIVCYSLGLIMRASIRNSDAQNDTVNHSRKPIPLYKKLFHTQIIFVNDHKTGDTIYFLIALKDSTLYMLNINFKDFLYHIKFDYPIVALAFGWFNPFNQYVFLNHKGSLIYFKLKCVELMRKYNKNNKVPLNFDELMQYNKICEYCSTITHLSYSYDKMFVFNGKKIITIGLTDDSIEEVTDNFHFNDWLQTEFEFNQIYQCLFRSNKIASCLEFILPFKNYTHFKKYELSNERLDNASFIDYYGMIKIFINLSDLSSFYDKKLFENSIIRYNIKSYINQRIKSIEDKYQEQLKSEYQVYKMIDKWCNEASKKKKILNQKIESNTETKRDVVHKIISGNF